MTRLLFRDVDKVYDFMRTDSRLYVPDSEAINPTLVALTAFAHVRGIPIVASADGRVISRPPCDPPHSGDFRAAYLASLVGVRTNSCLRDVRDKP